MVNYCFDGTCLNKNNEQGIPCVNLEDKPGCQCGIAFHNNTSGLITFPSFYIVTMANQE